MTTSCVNGSGRRFKLPRAPWLERRSAWHDRAGTPAVPRAARVTSGQPWHREPSRRGGPLRAAPEIRRSAAVRRGAHRALSKRPPRQPSGERAIRTGRCAMSKKHQKARGAGRRIIRWLVSAERLASAAAGNGEPAPLLALAAYRPVNPSVEQRPRRPDGMDVAGAIPHAVRPPRGRETNARHARRERSERGWASHGSKDPWAEIPAEHSSAHRPCPSGCSSSSRCAGE
jgi:hypothetical protein